MGVEFGRVSYDWFASQESLQVLEESGFSAGHRSVDKDDSAYLSLVNLFFEGRLELYKYEPFEKELFDLIHDRKRRKVDHPASNSKDVSDGLAGSVANALQAELGVSWGEEYPSVIGEINRGSEEEDLFPAADLFDGDVNMAKMVGKLDLREVRVRR